MRIVLLLLISLLLLSCGSDFAGTGQAGQARFEGVVYTTGGALAMNCTLTVADPDYTGDQAHARASLSSAFTVVTNEYGRVAFTLAEPQLVTISSQRGKELLLVENVEVTETVHLRELTFEKGTSFFITPWWEEDDKNELFTVTGTGWQFEVSDSGETEILLPNREVELIHHHEEDFKRYNVNPSEKSTLDISGSYDILFELPNNITAKKEFAVKVHFPTEFYGGGDVIYYLRDEFNYIEIYTRENEFLVQIDQSGKNVLFMSVFQDVNSLNIPGKAIGDLIIMDSVAVTVNDTVEVN